MSFTEKYSDYTLTEIRGDDIPVIMSFVSSTLPGAITDYDIYFYGKLRQDDTDANAIVKCSTVTGEVVVTDAPNKICQAVIPHAQTNVLPLSRQYLYCEWKVKLKAGGTIHTVDGGRGTLTLLPDILQTPV